MPATMAAKASCGESQQACPSVAWVVSKESHTSARRNSIETRSVKIMVMGLSAVDVRQGWEIVYKPAGHWVSDLVAVCGSWDWESRRGEGRHSK